MRLKVFRVEQVCFFELGWGKGQQMTAQIAYPETLTQRYETWQTCYLDFYRTSLRSPRSDDYQNECQNDLDGLRGRIKSSGTLSASPIDYRSRLVSAEAGFLAEFYDWLKSRELLEIRSKIASLASLGTESDLFLTCEPLALARFPWEVWEILGEFGQRSNVRIIRTPANLRHEVTPHPRSGKMRILVILGDETGLSFQSEITALKSLERFADVQFEGWRIGQSIAGLKERIAQRLVDPEGWDILFFAGHSNESIPTGGELAIGPQTSIFLREIQPQLLKAKENDITSKRSEPSSEPIIILAAGDYPEAGMGSSTDKSPPSAMAYWRRVQGKPALSQLTGAEIHAYMMYHALHKRTVTPIPKVLMVLLAGLFSGVLQSRRILATTPRSSSKRPWNIVLTCAIYGGISLQSFISAGVLLPWLLPSLVLWIYQIPTHSRKRLP